MPVIDSETQIPIEIKFENVGVHYYSIPRWFGGQAFKALQNVDLNVEDKSSISSFHFRLHLRSFYWTFW